jgi:hypothetical protein
LVKVISDRAELSIGEPALRIGMIAQVADDMIDGDDRVDADGRVTFSFLDGRELACPLLTPIDGENESNDIDGGDLS